MRFQKYRIADRFLHSLPARYAARGKMTALWAESWHRRWFVSLISITSRT